VMGKLNPNLGTLLPGSPKDRRFRALFGVSAQVVVDAWRLMDVHDLHPTTPSFVIFCGHLHSCAFTLRMTKLYLVCSGIETPRQFRSTLGLSFELFLNWMTML